MGNDTTQTPQTRPARALVIGLLVVIVVLGFALVIFIIQRSQDLTGPGKIDALAGSTNSCVSCHRRSTAGIVEQYGHSSMAAAAVSCEDCHVVDAGYPGSVEHEGSQVLPSPTTARCERCHQSEVAQFNQSRHGLPAWVAYLGAEDLSPELLAVYESIPEGQYVPNRARNAIAALEGEEITQFACETCHSVGAPAADGSVGDCSKCHIRHEFSLEQARKPETCNACHIGPDHPQWEIYQESPHGIAYATMGDDWNWEADPGTLEVADFPAPTCATCHFSGFGASGTTHDVGDRLAWFLFAPVSERRPAWQDNLTRMQNVCVECHNTNFVTDFYSRADQATMAVNGKVDQGTTLFAPLQEQDMLTDRPFDQTVEFVYFELWHHWGRTTKFGVWMQGPDYAQWHGAYEMEKDLVELGDLNREMLDASQAGQ